jgi:flagellar capping protein FliD
MAVNAFYNGITPGLWYTTTLFNQTFGASLSQTSGLPKTGSTSSSSTETTRGQLDALNGLYRRQYDVLAKAEKLSSTNGNDSVFFQKTAESSDTSVADVVYLNGNNHDGDVPDGTFDLEVTALLQEQINLSGAKTAADNSTIVEDSQLTITVDGTAHTIYSGIQTDDDWQTAFDRLSQAVNNEGIGVTATTLVNDDGTVELRLAGEEGEDHAFTVADGAVGNIVAQTSLGDVSQIAGDYHFNVDGEAYQQENDRVFLLDGGLEVQIQGLGEAEVAISPDVGAMTEAVDDLMDAMNEATGYMVANQYLDPALAQSWTALMDRVGTALSDYGVDSDIDGRLTLDEGSLTEALNRRLDDVRDAFGGPQGLVADIRAFSERILGSPGGGLLASPPQSGYSSAYLRSLTSAPRFRINGSTFWQVV